MAQILNIPFNSTTDFALCGTLASNGTYATGPSLATGIADRIWIADEVCHMYLNTTDADTLGWKRTEIDFGQFPSGAFGEFWTTFEFARDWTHDGYVVIGSWSVLISGDAGTTYVPLGFRIRRQNLIIQSAADLNTIGFSNQVLGSMPVSVGGWHKIVAHASLKSDGTGFREVFMDGIPLFRQWNRQTTYVNSTGHYFKLGPYDGNHNLEFAEAKFRLRNVATWSGNDGYNAVMGGAPIAVPRVLMAT